VKRLSILLLFCVGCPKKASTLETLEKQEREAAIEELIEDEDLFEDLPEAGDGEDDEER
jgi:hypothetical protein